MLKDVDVYIGVRELDADEREQLHHALKRREELLEKAGNAAEKELVENTAVTRARSIVLRLLGLFDDTPKADVARNQTDAFSRARTTKHSEKEKHQAISTRVVNALEQILGEPPAMDVLGDDDKLIILIADRFEDVEHVDQHGDAGERKWSGYFNLKDESGSAWLFVRGGGVPALWFDVDPAIFREAAIATPYMGKILVDVARAAFMRKLEGTLFDPSTIDIPEQEQMVRTVDDEGNPIEWTEISNDGGKTWERVGLQDAPEPVEEGAGEPDPGAEPVEPAETVEELPGSRPMHIVVDEEDEEEGEAGTDAVASYEEQVDALSVDNETEALAADANVTDAEQLSTGDTAAASPPKRRKAPATPFDE